MQEQILDGDSYRLEFWKKVLRPLEIFSLVLLGISFIFGPLRQATMGYRVFAGVLTGVVFQTLQDISGLSSLVFGFSPLMAVLCPMLVCALLGSYFLSKVR